MAAPAWQVHPLTPTRWADFERLFGPRGACAGCWCMWWCLPAAEWRKRRGADNRQAFRAVVRRGPPPGGVHRSGAALAHPPDPAL